jgi:hypothetical protein
MHFNVTELLNAPYDAVKINWKVSTVRYSKVSVPLGKCTLRADPL